MTAPMAVGGETLGRLARLSDHSNQADVLRQGATLKLPESILGEESQEDGLPQIHSMEEKGETRSVLLNTNRCCVSHQAAAGNLLPVGNIDLVLPIWILSLLTSPTFLKETSESHKF